MAYDNKGKSISNFIDPAVKSYLFKISLVGLLLIICTAFFSIGYYHFDEHYQIIEFVSFKLGLSPENSLAWEYGSKIRPWLQPAFYYQVAKIVEPFGITNPFTLALAFRLITGLLSWITLFLTAIWVVNSVKNPTLSKFFITILFTLCFIPYLSARTSSETFSGIFLTLGFLVTTIPKQFSKFSFLGRIKYLIAGLLFGLSIAARYQIGFGVFGFLIWMLFFDKSKCNSIFQISVGLLIPLTLGILVDHWGYGEWTFAPWNYYKANIIDGVAASFGVSPFWYYPILMVYHPMMPVNLLLLIGLITFWLRFFKHPITWITVFFIFFHSLVGHKETRFLFPILLLSLMAWFMAYQSILETPSYLSIKLRRFRFSKLFGFIILFNYVCLAFFALNNSEYNVTVRRHIYNNMPKDPIYVYGTSLFLRSAKFYEGPNYQEISLQSLNKVDIKTGFIATDTIPKAREIFEKYPQAKLVFRTLPAWTIKFNYFDWVSRTRIWSIILIPEEKNKH